MPPSPLEKGILIFGRVFALILVLVAAPLLAASPAEAAGTTLWAGLVRNLSLVKAMELGADGVHHIMVEDSGNCVSHYLTDRGGSWSSEVVLGCTADTALGADGQFHALVYTRLDTFPTGPAVRLFSDQAGTLVGEDVTEPGPPSFQANRGGIAIGPDGEIAVAWGAWNSPSVLYRSRGPAGWGDLVTLGAADKIPALWGLDVAFDSDGTAHILASGTVPQSGRPAECPDPDINVCTVDVTMSATRSTVGIGPVIGRLTTSNESGDSIEAIVYNDNEILHASDAGGPWTIDSVVVGNPTGATITNGTHGPIVFYSLGNAGARRADRNGSAWTLSTLTTAVDVNVVGRVDALDRSHVAFSRYSNQAAGWVGDAYLLAPDAAAPIVGVPLVTPRSRQVASTTIPTRIAWTASDALSGPVRYQLRESVNGGAWTTLSSTLSSKSMNRSLAAGKTYQYQVRAWDRAGNVSAYVSGPSIRPSRYQQTKSIVSYGGTWKTESAGAYSGGTVKYASSRSRSASITFTGRAFAWISRFGPSRGSARVFVDGQEGPLVSLNRSKSKYRVIAFSIAWPTSETHTITIKPAGTAGHPRIDLDAVVVIR